MSMYVDTIRILSQSLRERIETLSNDSNGRNTNEFG